jgi:hypothetical protein
MGIERKEGVGYATSSVRLSLDNPPENFRSKLGISVVVLSYATPEDLDCLRGRKG